MSTIREFSAEERAVYELIAREDGIKAREIASRLGLERAGINRLLVSSALMREICYQDREYRWHALIRQRIPHEGLYEVSAWYGRVGEFMAQDEEEWLSRMREGCGRIGRSLNDIRGLIHSFLDCRSVMRGLFEDLSGMTADPVSDWEITFELRFNRARYIRVYADVLVITPDHAFSLEFKMKNRIEPEEVLQAAKYTPYLEILLGPRVDVIPALVLTGAADLFEFVAIGETDAVLPVCSGDMLFNVFNEYLGFLNA